MTSGSRRWRWIVVLVSICVILSACGSAGAAVRQPTSSTSDPPQSTQRGGKPVVFIDPGHGGIDSGTTGYTADGTLVEEKTAVLQIGLRVAQKLRAAGYTVVMTRTTDTDPCVVPSDLTADGTAMTPHGELQDIQCRINKANSSGAKALLSIHMNTFDDPTVGGTETFYDSTRSFGTQNLRLAQLVQQGVIGALHAQGYTTPDRGVADDTQLQVETINGQPSNYNHLDLLGPAMPGKLKPSQMPGVLCEVFFLSDPSEASAVTEPSVQDLIAGAFAQALETFLSSPK